MQHSLKKAPALVGIALAGLAVALVSEPSSVVAATPNSPPVISSITNQLTQLNVQAGPISFTIADVETSAQSLTLTADSTNTVLVPLTNIVFGGADSTRTVTITPAPNGYGTSLITISVSDGLDLASTSFVLTVNSPPQLRANGSLTVAQGGTAIITSSLLAAADAESNPTQIVFTVAPGGNGGASRNGVLRMEGTNVVAGGSFTQNDLDNGRLSYQHDGGCEGNDDFQFNVNDGMGGVTPTGQFLTYSFRISVNLMDNPPVAQNGSASVPLAAPYQGSLSATNPDCLGQSLTFRILTNGSKGTAVLTNANTGGFVYTANPGALGEDHLMFQVNDGKQDAANSGLFTFTIENQAPVAKPAQFFGGAENTVFSRTVTATDADLPPQPLSFSVVGDASKGTVTFPDPKTGTFAYTPQPGRFGLDFFTFKVNDGAVDSVLASVMLVINPVLLPGRLLVTDQGKQEGDGQMVGVVDIQTGDQGLLTMMDKLKKPTGLVVEPSGTVLVADQESGLIRIDPVNGAQTVLVTAPGVQQPLGLAVETNGNIIVADPAKGPLRFSHEGVLLNVFPKDKLQFPTGVAVANDGVCYFANATVLAGNPAGNTIVRLDLATSNQTVVAAQGLLSAPMGVALEPGGTLLVANAGGLVGGVDAVLRINLADGTQTIVSSNNLLSKTTGVAVSSDGRIFTANGNGTVVQIDPVTGAQTQIGSAGIYRALVSIAVLPGNMPPPSMTQIGKSIGGYVIRFNGVPGQNYELLRSPTPGGDPWTSLATELAPISGSLEFEDTNAPAGSAYYRAKML